MLPDFPKDKIAALARNFGNTAVKVVRQHGRPGAEVLLALGLQGVVVLREQPKTFDEIADRLGGETAGVFLVAMQKHFPEIAQRGGLPRLLDRMEALPAKVKLLGLKYPQMLPFLIFAPTEVATALELDAQRAAWCLGPTDLSKGPDAVARTAAMFAKHVARAGPWIETRGVDGLLLADTFPTLVNRMPPMPLAILLQILNNNQEDVIRLLPQVGEDRLWTVLDVLAREDERLPERPSVAPAPPDAMKGPTAPIASRPYRGDWLQLACDDPRAIRLFLEKGGEAFHVLTAIWPDLEATGVTLPSLLYDAYAKPGDDPRLFANAWNGFSRFGGREREVFQILLLMAVRDGERLVRIHPRAQRFRQLLGKYDHRVILYAAEAEIRPEAADGRYRILEERGFSCLDEWSCPPSLFVQSIPLYDAARLGWLLAQGYTPTQGEVLFAGMDVALTAWDIATLGGGKAATTAMKTGLKTGSREVFRKTVSELAETAAKGEIKAAERATEVLLARLARSPKVVMEVAAKKTFTHLPAAVGLAGRSALRKQIPLTVLKYGSREYVFNLGVAGSLQGAAKLAANADNSVWAVKTTEVLAYLNAFLEQPIR